MSKKLKLIIDTNIVISFLISKNSTPGKAFSQALQNHKLFLSSQLLEELENKLFIPKFKKYFLEPEIKEFLIMYKIQ